MIPLRLETNNMFGTSGSGNQKKIWVDNYMIKIDSKNRESSKEEDAAMLAEVLGIPHANYECIEVNVDGKLKRASRTKSFLSKGEYEITALDILNAFNINIPANMSALEYIDITIREMSDISGIRGIVPSMDYTQC